MEILIPIFVISGLVWLFASAFIADRKSEIAWRAEYKNEDVPFINWGTIFFGLGMFLFIGFILHALSLGGGKF